ncbi:MAG TPA: hypothetical protein VN380_12460 [Thermoanaerobaculia bacterium]|jgi:hypothetical protein|nr:hypothetical protein [Thermoanaerobaculia bacterium]
MFSRKSLAKLFIFAFLQFGALAGVPMTPQQIEELMNVMHQTKIEYVVKKDDPPS